jgi:perosamine synthetase
VETWADHVFWMYTVKLRDSVDKSRDQIMIDLDAAGIETRPVFYPMHILPPYRNDAAGPFPNADHCGSRGINLPTHARLSENDIDAIVCALDESTR